MDTVAKRLELAGRRGLVRLFRLVRRPRASVALPIDLAGRRVLMLRQDRVGDVLVSLPIVHALKAAHPTMHLDALFGVNNHFAAPADPVFEHRFVYRKKFWRDALLLRHLRRARYDVVIDFMDNVSTSATLLVAAIGARCNVGIAKENAYVYDVVVPRLPQGTRHIVDRLGELLRPFGIDPGTVDLRLRYPLDEREIRRAADWRGTIDAPVLAGINVSASGVSKQWPEERFVAVGRGIRERFPAAGLVVFATPDELARARRIAAATGAAVFPPGGFDAFAAGVRQCSLLVTVDTSAVHLGAAFGIPTVALYVHDRVDLMPWTPYRTPHRAVETPAHTVASIPADTVLEAIVDLDRETSCCSAPARVPA